MENIQQIVHKSKILANRLKLAISHQNDLTQGNFDVTGLEFSKSREVLDKNLTSAEKKYNAIQDEILGVKGRVDEISEEYSVISEENSSLAKLENALLNRVKPLNAERYETAQELQSKLKAYKEITGVRFSFENSQDLVNGYIAISDDALEQCNLKSFEIDVNSQKSSQYLWDQINAICTNIVDCK